MPLALTSPKFLLLLILGVLLAVILAFLATRLYNGRPYHFVMVQQGALYRDGMRHPLQFLSSCSKGQIKSVISLIGDDEVTSQRFAPALQTARARGIKTLHVAVPLGGWPTSENVQQFLDLAQDPANQPVLAHCREGVRRTGMMVSAYRISVMGMTKEQAKAALETFGHSRRSIGDVEQFIDAYDPATRTVHYAQEPATTPAE